MSRLNKKCLIASGALHVLLLVTVFVGAAFILRRPPPQPNLPILNVIPDKLVDQALYGGGTPHATPPPPARRPISPHRSAPPPAPKPLRHRSQRQRPKPKPKPEPAPAPKPKPQTIPSENELEKEHHPKPRLRKPHEIHVNTHLVTRKVVHTSRPARVERKDRSAVQRKVGLLAVNNARQTLERKLSPGTTIAIPGIGGEAYANYAQAIKSIYDQAWIVPSSLEGGDLTVKARVVIARDGSIISSRIIGASGNTALDRSVRLALDRVTQVPAFPAGAKERERTFVILFNPIIKEQ